MPKSLTIITPTYNEEANILALIQAVREEMKNVDVSYIHLIIDNASKDATVDIVENEIHNDNNVALIVNTRNFGHVRSPYYALINCQTDGAIIIAADFEDPPSLIPKILNEWSQGVKLVCAVATNTSGSKTYNYLRSTYYKILDKLAETPIIPQFSGYALYDQEVISHIRNMHSLDPYLRGIVSNFGYESVTIPYTRPTRTRGISKNNVRTLSELALSGILFHTNAPLRMFIGLGILGCITVLLASFFYIFYKITDWDVSVGAELFVLGIFFIGFVQISAIGILSEYLRAIYKNTSGEPLVIEKYRKNY